MLESIIIGVSQIHEGLEREEGEGGDEMGTSFTWNPKNPLIRERIRTSKTLDFQGF